MHCLVLSFFDPYQSHYVTSYVSRICRNMLLYFGYAPLNRTCKLFAAFDFYFNSKFFFMILFYFLLE